MTWEQKLQACQALTWSGDVGVKMRKPGNWYVSQPGVEIKDKFFLKGAYGNGISPEKAVEDHFHVLTELKDGECVKADYAGVTRYVRWNGFMWADVPKSELEAA
jgi:hypothetical protein